MNNPHRLSCFSLLAIFWCLLSGHYTYLLLGLGAVSCFVVLLVYDRTLSLESVSRFRLGPVALIRYLVWLLAEIFKSNISVLKAVICPRLVRPAFFEVDTGKLHENGRVIYANSITLTPGTVSTGISDQTISVHALTQASRDGLCDNAMLLNVEKLVSSRSDNKVHD